MNFFLHPCLILFTDTLPGNHATLFGPTLVALPYRDDVSHFDNAGRRFTWAFELPGGQALLPGDYVVFATEDRQVVGLVTDVGTIQVVSHSPFVVVRGSIGKPLAVRDLEHVA